MRVLSVCYFFVLLLNTTCGCDACLAFFLVVFVSCVYYVVLLFLGGCLFCFVVCVCVCNVFLFLFVSEMSWACLFNVVCLLLCYLVFFGYVCSLDRQTNGCPNKATCVDELP